MAIYENFGQSDGWLVTSKCYFNIPLILCTPNSLWVVKKWRTCRHEHILAQIFFLRFRVLTLIFHICETSRFGQRILVNQSIAFLRSLRDMTRLSAFLMNKKTIASSLTSPLRSGIRCTHAQIGLNSYLLISYSKKIFYSK